MCCTGKRDFAQEAAEKVDLCVMSGQYYADFCGLLCYYSDGGPLSELGPASSDPRPKPQFTLVRTRCAASMYRYGKVLCGRGATCGCVLADYCLTTDVAIGG